MLTQSLLLKQLNVLIKMHIIRRRWLWLDQRKNNVECPSVIGPWFNRYKPSWIHVKHTIGKCMNVVRSLRLRVFTYFLNYIRIHMYMWNLVKDEGPGYQVKCHKQKPKYCFHFSLQLYVCLNILVYYWSKHCLYQSETKYTQIWTCLHFKYFSIVILL